MDWMPLMWGFGETDLTNTVLGYWRNFALTGNPNGLGLNNVQLPPWPMYVNDLMATFNVVGDRASVIPTTGVRRRECDFWFDHQPKH